MLNNIMENVHANTMLIISEYIVVMEHSHANTLKIVIKIQQNVPYHIMHNRNDRTENMVKIENNVSFREIDMK